MTFDGLNSTFFILDKDNRLNEFELLDEIESFIDLVLNVDIEFTDLKGKTYFSTDYSFKVVYDFLKEKYPDKAYLFSNYFRYSDHVYITNEKSNNDLNELIYKRLSYHLRRNDLDTAIVLLTKELDSSNINRQGYSSILDNINNKYSDLKKRNSYFSKLLLKIHLKMLIASLSNANVKSGIYFENGNRVFKIENNNDAMTPIKILHEYMHIDSYIPVYNELGINEDNYGTAYYYLKEFPSIGMEMQLLEWLLDNNYITSEDYRYVIWDGLDATIFSAVNLKAIKVIVDTYRKYRVINLITLRKELDKIKDIKLRSAVNSMIDELNLIMENTENFNAILSKLYTSFSYVMSTILSVTLLKRVKAGDGYRKLFLEVNDNLMKLSYEEALGKLNLLYTDVNVLEEITDNFVKFCEDYNNLVHNNGSKRSC